MRNFLLVLLLLNILAFLYQRWILTPEIRVDAFHIEQDYPGLTLIRKKSALAVPASAAAEQASQDATGAAVDESRCVRIGPFSREADAATAQAALEKNVASVSRTTEAGQVWVGHWVQVADQGSRASAEQARNVLVTAGMSDAYVLPGDDDNRISLGVFRLRSSARQVMEQATGLGYETTVQDRYQPGVNFWLMVRTTGNQSGQLAEFTADSGQILRTEVISCAVTEPDA
jgi:hypothetical protein